MRLAQRIIDDFRNVPEEHPKYTFPFLHYLTSATIIALGLIIKQPSFKSTYGALTLKATRSLREHCRKTWMSGKMIQTVWKLNQMADAILSPNDLALDHTSRFGDGTFAQLPTDGLTQPNSNINKSLSERRLMVKSTVQLPQSASATSMGTRSQSQVIAYKFNNNPPVPQIEESSAIADAQNCQGTRTTHERAGAVISILNLGGNNRPALQNDSSHKPDAFPHLTAHSQNHPEAQLGTRSDVENLGGHEHGTSSSQMYDVMQSEMGLDAPLPGQIINGGMEWLQSLFSNGLDSQILPVWD